jgi:hypothetical protein
MLSGKRQIGISPLVDAALGSAVDQDIGVKAMDNIPEHWKRGRRICISWTTAYGTISAIDLPTQGYLVNAAWDNRRHRAAGDCHPLADAYGYAYSWWAGNHFDRSGIAVTQ